MVQPRMVLFLGPLTNIYLSASTLLQTSTSTRGWTIRTALHPVLVRENGLPDTPNLLTWPADKLRNLFVAPLTEELVYRGLLVPYLLQLGVPPPAASGSPPSFSASLTFTTASPPGSLARRRPPGRRPPPSSSSRTLPSSEPTVPTRSWELE